MQQTILTCQEMFNNIREKIREGVKADGKDHKGFIKVSFFPINEEDETVYEFSCALDPSFEMDVNVISYFETFNIKKRTLYGATETEGLTDRVYIFKDFMEVTVRVGGAGANNGTFADYRAFAESTQEAISKSLVNQDDEHFSIEIG